MANQKRIEELVKLLEKQHNEVRLLTDQVRKKDQELAEHLKLIKIERDQGNLSNTIAYQLGHTLMHCFKSFDNLTSLPKDLWGIRKETLKRRQKRQAVNKAQKKVAKKQSYKAKHKPISLKTHKSIKQHKVAIIADPFTLHSYGNEFEVLEITPEGWQKEIEAFKPDFLFIESAWKGKDDLWERKVSNCTEELQDCIKWCRKNKIPSMFWNKEDPVHFTGFIKVASLVDCIFTTDVDMVPRYKKEVGHDNVHFLPFAAQTQNHNPIEIYDRKDAVNFAGSYYLRYIDRQIDFANLVGAVENLKPVEIYDRNFNNDHPHYKFPDKYKPYILGTLAFDEIDKAYKGYRYGINMNTIKQSQTMFARRVYELLASNTVVLSNFSQGVLNMFGDLVLCSESSVVIQNRFNELATNDEAYRRFRLQGLRKVLSEHTYTHRAAFIISKLSKKERQAPMPNIVLYAVAKNVDEEQAIIQSFERQDYAHKKLLLVRDHKGRKQVDNKHVVVASVASAHEELDALLKKADFVGVLNAEDYYGTHYLTDLALSDIYSDADGFGKTCHFSVRGKSLSLNKNGAQYKPTESLSLASSIVRVSKLKPENIANIVKKGAAKKFASDYLLAVDEFNYCAKGAKADAALLAARVDDMHIVDRGIPLEQIYEGASHFPAYAENNDNDEGLPQLSAKQIRDNILKTSDKIKVGLEGDALNIKSWLPHGKHDYVYLNKVFFRGELNFHKSSTICLDADYDVADLRTVFVFLDKKKQKISHAMNGGVGSPQALAIPTNTAFVKVGFRIEGPGKIQVRKLVMGDKVLRPQSLIAKSDTLVLTKQYPSYDDIYRYGFLHTRVKAYKERGKVVDIFRTKMTSARPFGEFEGINVATGDYALLDRTLATGQYKNVLIHLIDDEMWRIVQKHIDKLNVTVWVHGAEIQVWQRRAFEFENLPEGEIRRKKIFSDQRKALWQSLLDNLHPNLKFVFVSNYLKDDAQDGIERTFPKKAYQIIHNPVDTELFDYQPKNKDQRLKVLSIRPYSSTVYANDLSVKAIEILSQKPFFKELEFRIIGDGELFDATVEPLKKFANVIVEKRFLLQNEIADLHKQYGVFLCPTRMDSQGVSRDEAMSSGLVPVSNKVAAVPEFVDAKSGILAPEEDAASLAEAIEALYNSPKEFAKKSEEAAKNVRANRSANQVIDQELAIFAK